MALSTEVKVLIDLENIRHAAELDGSFSYWSEAYFLMMTAVETMAVAGTLTAEDAIWFNARYKVRTNATGVSFTFVAGGNSFVLTNTSVHIFTLGESEILDVQLKQSGYSNPTTAFTTGTLATYAAVGVILVFTAG